MKHYYAYKSSYGINTIDANTGKLTGTLYRFGSAAARAEWVIYDPCYPDKFTRDTITRADAAREFNGAFAERARWGEDDSGNDYFIGVV